MEREWLFNDEHRMFGETVRKWVAAELAPYADEWEKKGEFPIELFQGVGELGFFTGGLRRITVVLVAISDILLSFLKRWPGANREELTEVLAFMDLLSSPPCASFSLVKRRWR